VSHWTADYRGKWFPADVVAGLTAAAVVIPKAMAYATVAGLPVEVGLHTTLVPMAIYAVAGRSRSLSVSTTTTLAILTAAALAEASAGPDPASRIAAAATLALLVGVALLLAGALRLGFLANFISEPVLIGFKAGIGLVIVVDQLPKLLGLHVEHGSFVHDLGAVATALRDASVPTVAVGAATIAMLLAVEHAVPRVPAPLVALAGGIAATRLLALDAHGVATVGAVPTGLPPFTPPALALVGTLWPAALGIALMSFAETIAAGRAFVRSGDLAPRANRELVATGLANVGGSLLGAMPAGGGTTQTAVNRFAGAQTQLAGLVTAAVALVTMLVLAPLIGAMPEATLAAVVVVYSVGLIQPREFATVHAVRRTEFVWALAALGGVVLLGTLRGILVAIVVSLAALAYQVADPPVYVLGRKRGTRVFRPRSREHPDDESFPGLLLVRPEGRIFFGNAERVGDKMKAMIAEAQPRIVAIDMGGVFDIEYTALKMLTEAEKRERAAGVLVWLVGLNPGVLAMVQRSPLGATLGRQRMFFNVEQAVAAYQSPARGAGGQDTRHAGG
jgi:high affinity sulfate transporter 1